LASMLLMRLVRVNSMQASNLNAFASGYVDNTWTKQANPEAGVNQIGDWPLRPQGRFDQNRSIGADSSAGSGLPGALPPPNSLLEGGVSSLLNSSK